MYYMFLHTCTMYTCVFCWYHKFSIIGVDSGFFYVGGGGVQKIMYVVSSKLVQSPLQAGVQGLLNKGPRSSKVLMLLYIIVSEPLFWSQKKNVSESPPPPLWICCPFLGGPLCPFFFDGLGAFLLSQSALRSLKCPFWKWPCPSKSLIRAL